MRNHGIPHRQSLNSELQRGATYGGPFPFLSPLIDTPAAPDGHRGPGWPSRAGDNEGIRSHPPGCILHKSTLIPQRERGHRG
jgi:hypothetical protein